MEINRHSFNDWEVIEVRGAFRGKESSKFKEACTECLQQGKKKLAVDFHWVTFIDSTGMGTLIHVRQLVVESYGKLVLMRLGEEIYDLFEMTSVDQLFRILDSVDELETLG